MCTGPRIIFEDAGVCVLFVLVHGFCICVHLGVMFGRKNLADLSERQCRRRVRDNSMSILLGENLPNKVARSDRVPEQNAGVIPNDQQQSCSQDLNILMQNSAYEGNCSTNYSDWNENAQHEHHINVSNVEWKQCLSCLGCICFGDCEVCKHDSSRCKHCESCLNGDVINSDAEPLSSDEEDDIVNKVQQLDIQSFAVKVSPNIKVELARWADTNNISHRVLRDLMVVLNMCLDAGLPKDPRTLLHTPTSVPTRLCPPGLYWHAGLEKGLRSLDFSTAPGVIEITANVDGLPLASSSHSVFWPVLCKVNNFDKIILVGAYHGSAKPDDPDDFLKDYVKELNHLCLNGLTVNGKTIPVKKRKLICDAPAKSFVLKVKCHNAYCSCTKCYVEGEYFERRVVFPSLDSPLRSDMDFRCKKQEQHHTGQSILETIPEFDLIRDVPLDYMHLVLLGVVRKLLNLLTSGKLGVRLQSWLTNAMSELLEVHSAFIPNDFARKTRSLIYLKLFKATELRLLLFYVLPIVFTVLIDEYEERYKNFLVLHVAMTILASEQHLISYGANYPNDLLRAFVEGFKNIYGLEQVSHNVHNLIHLAGDVAIHGVVDNFSSFPFENFLQTLKPLIRKGEKPLQQLAKRYGEAEAISPEIILPQNSEDKIQFSGKSTSSCLPPDCGDPQFRCIEFGKFSLDVSPANRYCALTNGAIVEIHNIAYHRRLKCMVIIGKYFKTRADFYEYPMPSSQLGIYKVTDLSLIQWWPVKCVCFKYLRLPHKNFHVVLPIIHTVPLRN